MNSENTKPPVQKPDVPTPCGCPHMVLAMAYVLDQIWADTYEPEIGLCRGTIFPGLDKPFIGEEMPKK